MSDLNNRLAAQLEQLRAAGLERTLRRIDSPAGPRIVLDGRPVWNFASNDYLGLANHPALRAAAVAALDRYGVGAGASRLLSGNIAPYAELEQKLAAFKAAEAAIVFASGYAANVGTIAALVGPGDTVILDKLNHASIIDGARLSGATIRVYPHGHVQRLEQLLVHHSPSRRHRVLIVTETIFSMDGDCAPLADVVALKEKYGAWLMIDEAHATGVFGPHGGGVAAQLGVSDRVDITLGTLSKALGCIGGFVTGSRTLIEYLRNRARSLIYSTALPPSVVAAAAAAVDLLSSEEGDRRRERLWANIRMVGASSPILPVIVGDEDRAVALSRQLLDAGLYAPAIRYPTVPRGRARLRISLTAEHDAAAIQMLKHELDRRTR